MLSNINRLFGDDKAYLKINRIVSNGYQYASRKAVSVPEGNRKPDAVMIIARDMQGRLLVVKELRPVAGGYIYAFPAGKLDPGENPLDAAIREVKEETGLTLIRSMSSVRYTQTFSTPGLTDEIVAIVDGFVEGEITKDHLDGDEDITAYLMSPDDMVQHGLYKPETPMSSWLALALI